MYDVGAEVKERHFFTKKEKTIKFGGLDFWMKLVGWQFRSIKRILIGKNFWAVKNVVFFAWI